MNASEILAAIDAGEDKDWEFKSAKGGLPGSLWESYSALANTDGGVIVLGVKELDDGSFDIHGLDDPTRIEKNFWNTINDRGKASANLLTNSDVRIVPVNGQPLLVVQVPRASRRQRPIFVGQNPLVGTYRRFNDGDYLCSREEVGRMLADQAEESHDARIVEHFTLADLDPVSIQQYRNVFRSLDLSHPWLAEDDLGLLTKLGGWRKDRVSGQEGLTVAGLLMFGKDETIRDPAADLKYHVDYREKLSDDPNRRWTDRLTIDGKWVANLFQFYRRVSVRLPQDVVKTPFQVVGGVRVDDTPGHQALREALVNALIHADYRGIGGVVVEKRRDAIELSNPGSLLVSFDQLVQGGVSECRNPSLQTMFLLIGGGEKAGSGIDKIRSGWASQNLQAPRIEETTRPDRVRFVLPTVSLLPDEVLARLRRRFGEAWDRLSSVEVQALVLAETESEVANARLRLVTDHHAADLTQVLQGLVAKGLLVQFGQKRGTTYRLPPANGGSSSPHNGGSSPHNGGNSQHDEVVRPTDTPGDEQTNLQDIALPAQKKARLAPAEMETIIERLCTGRYLTYQQIGKLVNRSPQGIRDRFLARMVKDGRLLARFQEPTHPDQAYTTKEPT